MEIIMQLAKHDPLTVFRPYWRSVMTFFVGALISLALPWVAIADEIPVPKFKSPALEFVNRHEIVYRWDNNRLEHVDDLLLIGDITNSKLTFYVRTIGNNHHMCHVTGDARKEADHYLFTYQQCQLKIEFDTRKATVSDVTGQCRKYYCGMMGYIDSMFKRK